MTGHYSDAEDEKVLRAAFANNPNFVRNGAVESLSLGSLEQRSEHVRAHFCYLVANIPPSPVNGKQQGP